MGFLIEFVIGRTAVKPAFMAEPKCILKIRGANAAAPHELQTALKHVNFKIGIDLPLKFFDTPKLRLRR
jgi:hypothetical protein